MGTLGSGYQGFALDCMFGDSHGGAFPATFQFALYDGDPTGAGVECSAPSYERASIPNTSASSSTSSAHSEIDRYKCGVDCPTPGRSTPITRRFSPRAKRRAAGGTCRRAPGVP